MNAPDQHSNSSLIDSSDGKVHVLKQCDFYTNPTILSRLILNQKYPSALNRLKKHPEEASVWVCSKRNPFKGRELPSSQHNVTNRPSMRRLNSKLDPQLLDYSIRQLPIHIACNSLFRCSPQQRKDVERLITHLAVMYPDGCETPDHEGKLPLHEAIWHDASPETLSVLLMASPSTLHERDKFGRAPMELNRCRSGQDKEQVKDMLLRGVAYWESARTEAVSLTKRRDDKDVLKSISMRMQKGTSLGDLEQELVEPITWKKLEQRAIYLEQLLSQMYETNYEMGETVDALTHENLQLRDEVERLQSDNHGSKDVGSEECMQDLCEEIDFLRREIARLKSLLKKKNKSFEGGDFDADAVKYLEWNNMTLQNELQEVTERNRENEVRLARLEIVATKLRKKVKDNEARPTQSELSGLEGDDKGNSSVVDFMDLLAMISHQSPLATERYLADKVLRLQEQLNEAGRSVDLSSAASFADSTRLVQENELLQKKLSELSIQIRRKPEPPKVGKGSIAANQEISVGGNPYQTDSLDEMLQQAAGLYSAELSESKELAFSCFPGPPQEGERAGQESSLSGAFPPNTFPKDADMKAFEATDETGTWDSSHVRLLDVDPATKKEAKVEPRRLKLVEISTDAPEVVSHVPPRRVGPYSDSTERSESITISEVSMDSLIRSKRSLRRPSSSKSSSTTSLMGIPADIIVALRTASFSVAAEAGIEPLFLETEVVLGRPISYDIKTLIRSRYLAEGGDLSKLLLAWLKEALGDSDGSLSLSINDLDSIFAGADKIAEQMVSADSDRVISVGTGDSERKQSIGNAGSESGRVLSTESTESGQRIFEDSTDSEYAQGHTEPSSSLRSVDTGSSSGDDPNSVIRRQWASAFEETARFVSQRRLAISPSATGISGSSRFDPELAAEDLNQIFADAAKMYSLPLIASRNAQDRRYSQDDEGNSDQTRAPPPRTASHNASIAGTNNLIDDLIRDYKSKYND